jgi:hypothetical protein
MQKLSIVAAGLIAAVIPLSVQAARCAPAAVHPKTVSVKSTPAKMAPLKIAPADEYFGRMKMSILGISNTIRDTGLREGFNPSNAATYYGGLMFAQDALRDWARKYPADSWIPRRAYDMSHDFWMMHTPQGDAAAQSCRALLFRQFPHDHWTSIARKETALSVAPTVVAPVASNTAAPQSH